MSDDQENLPEWEIDFGDLAVQIHQTQLASIVHQFLERLGYDQVSKELDLTPDEEEGDDTAQEGPTQGQAGDA